MSGLLIEPLADAERICTLPDRAAREAALRAGEGMSDAIARLEALGKAGFTVSIVYGPCGNSGPMYSVNVLTPDFRSFDKPFGARDFAHCVEIAETEIRERGWTIS